MCQRDWLVPLICDILSLKLCISDVKQLLCFHQLPVSVVPLLQLPQQFELFPTCQPLLFGLFFQLDEAGSSQLWPELPD